MSIGRSLPPDVDILDGGVGQPVGWGYKACRLFLLCELTHDGQEIVDRLLSDLDVNDETRAAELEGVGEVLSSLCDLVVVGADR